MVEYVRKRIELFLREMDSGGINSSGGFSAQAPDNMIKLVDISKSEDLNGDETSNLPAGSK